MSNEQERIDRIFAKILLDATGRSSTAPTGPAAASSKLLGAGVDGCIPGRALCAGGRRRHPGVATKNTAKNVIFILLAGAPSHTDTFDLKVVSGVTPASFNPETINGIAVAHRPAAQAGASMIADFAIVRSMRSHALVHSLAQTWTQIGRNPAAALGNIAPNIGSIVAIEKEKERQPGQVFPTFLALNSGGGVGAGYLRAQSMRPFRVTPATSGIANTTNPDDRNGTASFNTRWSLLHALDDSLRVNSPNGTPMEDYDDFYAAAPRDDVQPGGQPGVRVHRCRQHALRFQQPGQRLPGGLAGAEGEPGDALHPDHLQRRLGHAPEHLRRQSAPAPRPRSWTTAVAALLGGPEGATACSNRRWS